MFIKQNIKNEEFENRLNDFQIEEDGKLTIDVYQTPEEFIIESIIAAVDPEDLDINITSESITIKGERTRKEYIPESDYLYQECYWGRFSRSVILPQEIDIDKSSAEFKNGILKIFLPKIIKEKNKKLKIKTEN
ncbi:MAG: Hsp20/alpha crystallin family protein [Candidatus Liptonbacteria bacterium]|nr:Hsp20/alpha crystallin family protein [Candidatus Liptonbacteria bacterium]